MTGRTYYDHERAYARIAAAGGTGWDDLFPEQTFDSYGALARFLASPFAPAGARAIDLGCGGGQASRRLAARGYEVLGVDFAETAVALARAHVVDERVRFVQGDCLALEAVADGAFDLAIDNHVLHCLIGADRARFLGEVARVLRVGGLLFSETTSRDGDLDPAMLDAPNRYWTTREELDADLVRAGFEVAFREARAAGPGEGTNLVTYARRG